MDRYSNRGSSCFVDTKARAYYRIGLLLLGLLGLIAPPIAAEAAIPPGPFTDTECIACHSPRTISGGTANRPWMVTLSVLCGRAAVESQRTGRISRPKSRDHAQERSDLPRQTAVGFLIIQPPPSFHQFSVLAGIQRIILLIQGALEK